MANAENSAEQRLKDAAKMLHQTASNPVLVQVKDTKILATKWREQLRIECQLLCGVLPDGPFKEEFRQQLMPKTLATTDALEPLLLKLAAIRDCTEMFINLS